MTLLTCNRHSRNWRWHKKLRVWLTKDDMMTPHSISPSQEQGYYIVWDKDTWSKSRVSGFPVSPAHWAKTTVLISFQREMVLYYDELETSLGNRPGV